MIALALSAALLAPVAQAASQPGIAGENPIAMPWTARGNEPNWLLTIDAGRMVYKAANGAVAIDVALPKAETLDGGWIYRATDGDLAVTLQPKLCHDTMTGMPSPISVSIETGGTSVSGCGGNPADLLADGEWRVTAIGNEPVAKDVVISLDFDVKAGSVFGSSGCNRYFGGFSLTGEGLTFKPGMAGSMMACEEPPSRLEAAFLSALAKVDRFDIDAVGSLHLITADSVAIKATRDHKN